MAKQTLKEKTANGLFWGGVSNGAQQLLGVLIGIILLKNLSPEDYGMIGMLAIFTGIASTIQESGFTAALTNRPTFKKEDYNSVFWFNVIVGSGIYVILFFSAPFIAKFYNQPDLVLLSRILFLSIVIGSLGIAHNAVLFRELMVKQRAKIDIFSTALSGIAGIYLAINGYGCWALAIQTLVYTSLGTIFRWIFSPWKPIFKFNFTPVKEMFGFGTKMLISTIVAQIQINIFSVLLGKYYTKADVGYYSQGTKWSNMGIQVMDGMVISVAQPIFARTDSDKNRQVFVFRKIIRFIAFVTCPCLLGLAFVSRDFINIINKEFMPCVPILQIYCIVGIIIPICSLYNRIIISEGKAGSFLIVSIIYAIFQILVAFVTFRFGMYWMAFAVAIITFLSVFVWHIFASKCIPIKLIDVIKDMAPYLACTLFVLFLTYLLTKGIVNLYVLFSAKIIIAILLYIAIMKVSNSTIFNESVQFFKQRVSNK